ncbi:hypothetical protein [Streptomyces cellulosae]|uniref:Uncharacterized protein n=1 Tax=Streptomyces cellulosae TaxID=1968 RepID=A0ABW7Y4P4_STRCE
MSRLGAEQSVVEKTARIVADQGVEIVGYRNGTGTSCRSHRWWPPSVRRGRTFSFWPFRAGARNTSWPGAWETSVHQDGSVQEGSFVAELTGLNTSEAGRKACG